MNTIDNMNWKNWLMEVLLVTSAVWLCAGAARACPEVCRCSLDGRGRRSVRCEAGGMLDPIPVMKMAVDTEVLVITGPPYHPNTLTLGPIFKELRRLEEIHITWASIPALGAHSFWGLQRLHVLNLTHNHIATLMDTNFRGADVLQHLDLSHNLIESVPSAVFRHVRRLQSLTLAHNMVPELVPRIFFGLTRLEKLDLSYNPLGDLQPEQFSDVPELQKLVCAGCGLSSLSSSLLQALTNLHTLDLHNNRLTQVPSGVATTFLPKLIKLNLDANLISFVEHGVIAGSSLSYLHLAHNRINRVEPGAFANSSLKYLDLSYNRLVNVDNEAIRDALDDLYELDLSGNSLHIEQLLFVLPAAQKLQRLGLGDMGLMRLPPGLLQNLSNLLHLNVSSNYLSVFPTEALLNAPQLRSLDLSRNSFRGLDDKMVSAISASKKLWKLRLEGNPWHCDQCHIGPLLRWLQDAPDQESGCDEPRVWTCLKCVSPSGVEGLELALLPLGDLPMCPQELPAAAPSWNTPALSEATIEPMLPRSQLTIQEDVGADWSMTRLFKEKLHMVIVIGCCIVLLLLILVIVAVVAYSRHSAFYYTCEGQSLDVKKLKAKEAKNNNKPSVQSASRPDVTIATIDEMTDIAGSQELLEEKLPHTEYFG
ncbi:insulin-like growth factor-binding protein complex acid labile subunit [Cherax quadricarinatus]|uniref:insulin-like growth factor-binding protein complex acid labile subunit n=1 Tax=Cherax quadricarinatus TaxID=27406 RepID=UPI00387E7847